MVAAPAPYTFSVYAGSGGTSSSLDGNGTAASFLGPYSISVDGADNLYVADYGNHLIRKITPTGDVTTLAGAAGQMGSADGTGSNAHFNSPLGVTVDADGQVYVSDAGNVNIRKIASTGEVTTLAGTVGQSGNNDGTGTAARFGSPRGLTVDRGGNVFVADYINSTIRRITPSGDVTTFAGAANQRGSTDGPAADARFNSPADLAVAPDGSLYIADSANYTIRRIAPDGMVTTIAGTAGSSGTSDGRGADARFLSPFGIAVDRAGKVYVTDSCTLRTIASDGTVTTVAGVAGQSGYVDATASAARFGSSSSVAVDSTGQAFVVDSVNQAIRVVTSAGAVRTFAGGAGSPGRAGGPATSARFSRPRSATVGSDGVVYVADWGNQVVRRIDTDGNVSALAESPGPITALRSAADRSGNIYASDGNSQIFKITSANAITVLAGDPSYGYINGTGTAAKFRYPEGIAADRDGNLYVADRSNNVIRKIMPSGVVSTFAGDPAGSGGSSDGLAANARFNNPRGVAVDRNGNVYVADTYNCTIRKITPQGWVTTFAGSPVGYVSNGGSADGIGAEARFNNPYDVAVDAHGYLYVADASNHTIRGISPDGVVTTLGGLAGATDYATGTGSNAHFASLQSISVSDDGLLYVADGTYNTILVGSNQSMPTITTSPGDLTATETETITLAVTTTGGYVNYQWRKDGVPIDGAIDAKLTLDDLKSSDAGSYDVVVSNSIGAVTSSAATLTVSRLAVISDLSSARQTLQPGDTLNLSVTASGTGLLHYEWVHDGHIIPEATASSYVVAHVAMHDAGWYEVMITDDNGTRRSATMFVSVAPARTQVRAWGANGDIQTVVPVGLGRVISVATNGGTVLALRDDGTVTAWGYNSFGQCDVPAGLSDVVAVAAGGASLALKSDGTVVAWGDNRYGAANVPPGLSHVVAVAAGGTFSLALKDDGMVVAWGDAGWGQTNVPAGLTDAVAITASYDHSLALRRDGTVLAWGSNSYGQSAVPDTLSSVAGLAAILRGSLALKSDGSIVGWGLDADGTSPGGLSDVIQIAAGNYQALALRSDASVVAWGSNSWGESTVPDDLGSVWSIAAGGSLSVALRDATDDSRPTITAQPQSQTVIETHDVAFSSVAAGVGPFRYQWRKDGVDILGATNASLTLTEVTPGKAGDYGVVVTNDIGSTASAVATLTVAPLPVITSLSPARNVLAPGQNLTLSVTATGTGALSYQWVHNGQPVAGATTTSLALSNATKASAGWYVATITDDVGTRFAHPIFVTVVPTATQVRAWGSLTDSATPPDLTDAVAVAAGDQFALALKRDGTVVGWGVGGNGGASVPDGLADVVAIDASTYGLALKSDGMVVAWGAIATGLLTVPAGLHDIVAISAGQGHALALRNDGKVTSFGAAWLAPGDPADIVDVINLSAGAGWSVVQKRDGSVAALGSNSYGSTNIPAGLSGVTALAAGNYHGLALDDRGLVTTWGYNNYGQTTVPAGLSAVTAVAAGGYHSLALRSDGSVVAWGYNNLGQSIVPTGLDKVFAIDARWSLSVALRDATGDTTPIITQQPSGATLAETSGTIFSVAGSGAGPLIYQWRKNGVTIDGATASTLALSDLLPEDSGSYDVVVTNHVGDTSSSPAVLTVNPIPTVTLTSPARQVLTPGQGTNLGVSATGTGALSYQWEHNGRDIAGATSPAFNLIAVTRQDNGWYVVRVTDTYGTRYSKPFFLDVAPVATQVRAWGDSTYGQTSLPSGLNDAIAVSAGSTHALALKRDGTVVAWGSNYNGKTNVPAGLTDVVAVAAGGDQSLALKRDGTVVAWGIVGTFPSNLSDVVAIAAGEGAPGSGYGLALKSNGTVVSWTPNGSTLPGVPAGLNSVIAIASGTRHALALLRNGNLVGWGSTALAIPAGLNDVVAIADGDNNSGLALQADGSVATLGSAWAVGELAPSFTDVTSVDLGSYYALALKGDGTVTAWGSTRNSVRTLPPDLANVIAIAAGESYALALRDATDDHAPVITTQPVGLTCNEADTATFSVGATGSAPLTYQWSKDGAPVSGATLATLSLTNLTATDAGAYVAAVTNNMGTTVSQTAVLVVHPLPTVTLTTPDRHMLLPGENFSLSATASGTGTLTYQWIHDGRPVAGANASSFAVTGASASDSGWYALRVTDEYGQRFSAPVFVMVMPATTQVQVWGYGYDTGPVVAAGESEGVIQAVVTPGVTGVVTLLRGDGTVFTVGNVSAAQPPAGLDHVVALAAATNGSHILALKSDGSVVSWGYIGGTAPTGLNHVAAIAAAGTHSLALLVDGRVVCWGSNDYGQSTPPSDLSGVVAIAAGSQFSVALKNDGTVVTWGSISGAPPDLAHVVAVAAGSYYALALKDDGTVVSWGSGSSDLPSGLANVTAVAAGFSHSAALLADGSLASWGSSNYEATSVPDYLADPARARVMALASGYGATVVLRNSAFDAAPVVSAGPTSQTVTEGDPVTFTVDVPSVGPLYYQWRKDGSAIDGATTASFTLDEVTPSAAGNYDVVITNAVSSATSGVASLAVRALPVVTNTGPARQVLAAGDDLVLQATASGTGALTVQWLHNGREIAGANALDLALTGLTPAEGGWYALRVRDEVGTRYGAPIFVTLVPTKTAVSAWGTNSVGQVTVPGGLAECIALSAGDDHTLALQRDGTVVAWGGNYYGQSTVPSGLDHVVAVTAGQSSSYALCDDATVTAWGDTSYGKISVPSGLRGVVAIAAGTSHALALKSDGTVVAWGSNSYGQCSVPTGLASVVAIAAGGDCSFALQRDGSFVAWGSTVHGATTLPSGLANVRMFAASMYNVVALKEDGTVIAWGRNTYGISAVPSSLSGITAIALGKRAAFGIKSDETLTGWGSGAESTAPADLGNVIAVSVGDGFALALRDASGDQAPQIDLAPSSQTVAEGSNVTLTVTATGTAPLSYQWRKGGQPIAGATSSALTFTEINTSAAGDYDVVVTNALGIASSPAATLVVNALPVVTNLSASRQVLDPGSSLSLSVNATGTGALTYQWLHNGREVAGATGTSFAQTGLTLADSGWYGVRVTDDHGTRYGDPFFVTVVPALTQVRGWGAADSGQLAIPPGLNDVVSFCPGGIGVLALHRDGTVTGWGSSGSGIPAGLTDIVAVAGGSYFSLALKADGTVVAWGSNSDGQTSVPSGLRGVVAIATTNYCSFALKTDGTVVAWGSTSYDLSTVPHGLANVAALATGGAHVLALKRDGTVVGWGYNSAGQCNVPDGLANVVAIAANTNNSLALQSDGKITVWGYNGVGGSIYYAAPARADAVALACGDTHALALQTDGTVLTWGFGPAATAPVGLGQVVSARANSSYSLILRDATGDAPPTITAAPLSQTVAEGQTVAFTVTAAGAPELTYQWRKAGAWLPGVTTPTLTLTSVSAADAGAYDVVVSNGVGSVTSTVATLTVKPVPVITHLSPTRQVVAPGQSTTLSVIAAGTGTLGYQWSHNGRAIPGATGTDLALARLTYADAGWYVVDIADSNGTRRSAPLFVLVAPGRTRFVGWGQDNYGKSLRPNGLSNPVAIAAGFDHSVALNADGTIVTWGLSNSFGYSNPTDSDIVAVAAGINNTLGLHRNGTTSSWGATGASVGSVDNIVAIATSGYFSMALQSDGSVRAWGSGEATIIPSGLQHVVAIAAGWTHALALKSDGTITGWGSNTYGESTVPTGLTDVVAIAASSYHSLALKADGTVVVWGSNSSGESTVPPGLTGVVAIACGNQHSLALKADGRIVAWGRNDYGQTTPPTSATHVFAIAAGENYSLALCDDTAETAPAITAQPSSLILDQGQTAQFSVTATGTGALTYRWYKGDAVIAGATNDTYSIPAVTLGDAADYTVEVSDSLGTALSAAAALAVVVVEDPAPPKPVSVGQSVSFTVTVTGSPSTYQWYKDGAAISGATAANYTVVAAKAADAGSYTVDVTTGAGTKTSAVGILTVGAGSYLSNLSVRAAMTEGQTLIVGFVIQGGAKPVLVRAAGPALHYFGLAGVANPHLTLYDEHNNGVGVNEDWDSSLAPLYDQLGAFPFEAGSKDAALQQAVDGPHTVHVSGQGNGAILVEGYDAGPNDGRKLVNLSARYFVGTGNDILIAGFVVAGTGTQQVLIRAVGPSLASYGVSGPLADPKLGIYNEHGAVVVGDDDWDASLSPIFKQLGAFDLLAGSHDAALVVTLPAGKSYTAQVSGADGGTGEALVEIYALP